MYACVTKVKERESMSTQRFAEAMYTKIIG